MKQICSFFLVFSSLFGLEIGSIRADFTQSIHSQPIAYEGRFVATSPNLAKWEYTTPLKKVVYINANKVIAYEPMLSQVIIKKIQAQLDFIAILQKARQDLKDPNLYHSRIDNTTYTIQFQNNLPAMISYEDSLGERIIITLKNVIVNQKIPKEEFDFEIPSGIDVIEE